MKAHSRYLGWRTAKLGQKDYRKSGRHVWGQWKHGAWLCIDFISYKCVEFKSSYTLSYSYLHEALKKMMILLNYHLTMF